MNRSLAAASAFVLVAIAGCAAPQGEEELVGSDDAALAAIADEPAEVPAGAKPKVETIDLSSIAYDLPKDPQGTIDFSKLKIDVLDRSWRDDDFRSDSSRYDMKWVESDRRELPSFIDKAANGIDVGGGKCRIKSISLKKLVVGCKWTW